VFYHSPTVYIVRPTLYTVYYIRMYDVRLHTVYTCITVSTTTVVVDCVLYVVRMWRGEVMWDSDSLSCVRGVLVLKIPSYIHSPRLSPYCT
jgi:hypothetical protein